MLIPQRNTKHTNFGVHTLTFWEYELLNIVSAPDSYLLPSPSLKIQYGNLELSSFWMPEFPHNQFTEDI